MREVLIVDYGMGNLRSLARAFERAGAKVSVSDDPRALGNADRVVIPGQGAFGQAVDRLTERALVEPLREHAARGRPLFGVCLGLQLFYETSKEAPGQRGLGIIPGEVELLPISDGIKRPHIGWAPVEHRGEHPIFAANPSGEAFYFVHSFAATHAPGFANARTTHGVEFIAAVARDAIAATQFHPEKSQDAGDRLIHAWLDI